MKFDGFFGNLRIKEYLSNAFGRGEVSNAYLISGPMGIGKKTLAGILSRAIVCEGEGEKPCGVCPACLKSAKDSHPDIIRIYRDGTSISVKTIRSLKQDAYLRPNEGARKVYLIHEAESMTQEAQNAFLKILEEPPAFTVFLLLCYNEKSLLETVRSRCVRLSLAPLSREEGAAFLEKRLPQLSDCEMMELAMRAEGIMGSVLENAEEDESDSLARGIISSAATGDGLTILEYMVSLEKIKRNELLSVLERTAVYLNDGFVLSAGGAQPICPDMREKYERLFRLAGHQGAMRIIDAVERARGLCERNVGTAHITGFLAYEFIRALRT